MEPQSTGVRTWQWVVTVIVIIALIIIGIVVFGTKKVPVTDATPTPVTDNTNAGVSDSVILSDQFPGNVVYVSSVSSSKPVWVVIHKDNNGQPGAVIGSQYFDAGVNTGKITLTSPTVDGGTYYAMLHSDNGDKVFNESSDAPLKDSRGNIIMRVFHATFTANSQIKG